MNKFAFIGLFISGIFFWSGSALAVTPYYQPYPTPSHVCYTHKTFNKNIRNMKNVTYHNCQLKSLPCYAHRLKNFGTYQHKTAANRALTRCYHSRS